MARRNRILAFRPNRRGATAARRPLVAGGRALWPLALATLAACSSGTRSAAGIASTSSSSSMVTTATALPGAVSSATPTSAPPASVPPPVATGEEAVLPIVFIHGIGGTPDDYSRLIAGISTGRKVVLPAFADDLAALAPRSLPRDSIFAIDFYRRASTDPRFYDGKGSIGGCPVARTDAARSTFTVAYVDTIDDAVEAILRATGAPRVDLVGSSMGGIVSRAYVRWRSGRGPLGQSRVRRLLLLESPERGINDLGAAGLAFDKLPFMRWGECAELARNHKAWGGRSYVDRLNDGWSDWCRDHGVTFANSYGVGHRVLDFSQVARALQSVKGQGAQPAANNANGAGNASATGAPPPAPAAPPNVALTPTSPPDSIKQALIFIDPLHLDLIGDAKELLGDGDGTLPAFDTSHRALGADFAGSVFDQKFIGRHFDRGQPDETIEYATNSRELVRRFVIEGRAPRATVARAAVRTIQGGGNGSSLLVDVDVSGGDGVSIELFTWDLGDWLKNQALKVTPADPIVRGFPLVEGPQRILVAGEPTGRRVARLVVYDTSGIVADHGPIFLDVRKGSAADVAPATKLAAAPAGPFAAELTASSNAPGATFSFRVVEVGKSAPAWSAFAPSTALRLRSLAPGTYHVQARSAHAANGAAEEAQDPVGAEAAIVVAGDGTVSVR